MFPPCWRGRSKHLSKFTSSVFGEEEFQSYEKSNKKEKEKNLSEMKKAEKKIRGYKKPDK